MLSNILDRISFWSLFAVIVLLPVFFLPFTKIPIETSKGLLLIVGLVISIIFWTAARFSDGKVTFPRSWILVSGLGVLLAFLLSALFSSTLKTSLFGIMLDVGTFYFMFGAFLLMLVSSIILKDIKRAKIVFWGVIISSTILFVFQVARLFLPEILSLGLLGGNTDNVLGSWNALGLFAGFSAIMSLFLIEFFSISKKAKWLLSVLILLSVILIAAVNFPLVWVLLGIFSLIVFVYKVSLSFSARLLAPEEAGEKKNFPVFSFAVVMISLLFFVSGQFIGSILPNTLGLSNLEIRPSFSATMQVTGGALMQDPIFGVGPNKFQAVWAMYKPAVINGTQFWDTSFNSGSGLLPTFASTTGGLGIIALLAFFALFIFFGIRAIFSSIKNNMNWEIVMFFVASLYLFVSAFFYSTGGVMFLLAFAFTGVFIGLSSSIRQDGEISVSFLDDPRKSFVSILFLVIIMIATAAIGFKYIERFASVSYFANTLSATTMEEAEDSILKALSLHQNDLYLRTYAQVYLSKINSIISENTSATSLSDEKKALLQESFNQAVAGAQGAVSYDKMNYLNYTSLGSVYSTVGGLGVADAYQNAIKAYEEASLLNPQNPGIKLAIAGVYNADKKTKEAKDYANQALTLKGDYIEALLTLSQLEKNDGNNTLAISYAEKALFLLPNNKDLAQYVNSLKNPSSASSATPPAITTPSDVEETAE